MIIYWKIKWWVFCFGEKSSFSVLNARLTMRLPTSTFVRHTGFAEALDGLLFSSNFLLFLWLEGATESFKHIFGLSGSDYFNGVFLTLQHCQTIFLLYKVLVSCYISVQLSFKVEWNIIILHKRFLYQPSQSTGLELIDMWKFSPLSAWNSLPWAHSTTLERP